MKKFTESLNNIKKVPAEKIKYYDLFSLLKGLESERPGIKDRVWKWMCDEWDVAFKPYNGRISTINLFYYGVGDEYPIKYLEKYPGELSHSKSQFPESFIDGNKNKELRLDLNLIWSVYEDEMVDSEARLGDPVGMFAVLVQW